jgi:hypothetical protein
MTIPVLENDSDPDGDRLTMLTVTQPNDPGFTGEDNFTHEACNQSGVRNKAEGVMKSCRGGATRR